MVKTVGRGINAPILENDHSYRNFNKKQSFRWRSGVDTSQNADAMTDDSQTLTGAGTPKVDALKPKNVFSKTRQHNWDIEGC